MATQRALPEDRMLRVCCFGELPEVYAEQLGVQGEVGFAPCPICQRIDEPVLMKYLVPSMCLVNRTTVISAISIRGRIWRTQLCS